MAVKRVRLSLPRESEILYVKVVALGIVEVREQSSVLTSKLVDVYYPLGNANIALKVSVHC